MSTKDDMKKQIKGTRKDPRPEFFGGKDKDETPDTTPEGVVNVNMNANTNELPFDLDDILGDNNENKKEKELVGIYFDPEVKTALAKVNRKKGRGAKSEFVNNIVKWALIQKGYM
ncbi:hypothetical protein OCO53_25500 [Peribacillus frigoritolerans]|uniref:hypothetical protein n=1 Tax=Peribacillus frigoritolerans TaxID=450367 RepID=UPI0021CEEB0C|nr:hypothetical protein [Peribacillus frigoritolerans]MCU6603799.1 hypothetical protein [Peribacillus frigoritolerans]